MLKYAALPQICPQRRGVKVLLDVCLEVDILVNNLGIFEPKAFEAIQDADWEQMFDVNVMSGVRLSRLFTRDETA